jgi:hypothetical protein
MFAFIKMLPLILILAGSGYAYHQYTVNGLNTEIAQLESNNAVLKTNVITMESALEKETRAREKAENNLQNQLKAVGELTERANTLAAERDEYVSIFKRHDLTKLARVKPGLIEPRINNGTEKVFRSIEQDSREVADADETL